MNKGNLGRLRQGRGLAVVVNGLQEAEFSSEVGKEAELSSEVGRRRSLAVRWEVSRKAEAQPALLGSSLSL